MAQLVASMSGVVLGGVVEVVGSNLARGKLFTASIGSIDSLHSSVFIYCLNLHQFEVTINIQSGSKWPLTTKSHFVCNIYKPGCLQNRISFVVSMLTSSTWLLGLVVMEQISIG